MSADENMESAPSELSNGMGGQLPGADTSENRQNPRPGTAVQRIKELNDRSKFLEAKLNQALQMNERVMAAFESQMTPKMAGPKGVFDEYSDEQLEGAYAESLNKDSDGYNPQKAALYMRELRKRDRESVKNELMSMNQVSQQLVDEHTKVYNESVAELGEDAIEFDNPSSPLKMLAVKEWNRLLATRGDKIKQNPEYQRIAIQSAYAQWQARKNASPSNVPNSQTRAREALSSGMEAEIDNATSIKSHFARGDVKGGLMKMATPRMLADSVRANMRPK